MQIDNYQVTIKIDDRGGVSLADMEKYLPKIYTNVMQNFITF